MGNWYSLEREVGGGSLVAAVKEDDVDGDEAEEDHSLAALLFVDCLRLFEHASASIEKNPERGGIFNFDLNN